MILCLADPAAAQALHDLGIAVELVDLPPELRAQIAAAQQRRYR
jgi:hypothetical protein